MNKDDLLTETEAERICRMATERGDFVMDADGYMVYWPDSCPHGALSEWMLRALADELERRNTTWDAIVKADPAISIGEVTQRFAGLASDWFSDEHEFRQLCGDAQSQAATESAQEFAAEMMLKANQYGLKTYLSQRQLEYLCKLADWDVPRRRTAP